MKKWIPYLLICAGIVVLLYPKASEWYSEKQQEKLMQQWEDALEEQTAADSTRQEFDMLNAIFDEFDEEEELSLEALAAEATPDPTAAETAPAADPIATIKIASIKLKLPVLEGATQKNLKNAAAHMSETAPIGKIGNAAIAAHRMKAKGRLFNRLNEVKVGDKIIIETKNETYTYTVYDTSRVKPTDVSVLNYNNKDKLLTLITCDPIVNPTHRLIVHAKMEA